MKKNKYSIRDIIRRLLIFAALMIASHATRADELQPVWSLAPGDVSFLGTGNTDRGIAYNKATGHLLVASRVDVTVHILDAATGVEIGVLNNGDSIIQGGTYPMNMIGTTDDGAIYVGNLSTSLTTPNFKLYRWESETNDAPTLAFEGDPSGLNDQGASVNPQRWGDSMDVRGSSTNAQILLGSRNGSVAALISTTNGVDHTSILISNAAAAGSISVAFGAGNTFFTKITAAPAREVSFDPATGTGTVLNTLAIGNNVVPIAVNAASNWLAGIEINRVPPETPDNLILYNISDRSKAPAIIDQEAFAGTADNANFVGYVVFEGDMVFALDTNNGLAAYRVVPTINPPSFATQPIALSILDGGFGSLTASLIGTPPLSYQWAFNGTTFRELRTTACFSPM